jgi:hypothetical protein
MTQRERHLRERCLRHRRPARARILTLLVVLNVALAVTLFASVYRMPAAFAQAGLQRGQFISATVKASGFSYDVLFIIDLADHRLHAFYPGVPKTRKLVNAPSRDLYADFGKDQGS